jgi:UDPglucose 6-dehydrogenase
VLVTDWPEIVSLDWNRVAASMRRKVLVDGRNALSEDVVRRAGFTYEGIGRAVIMPTGRS